MEQTITPLTEAQIALFEKELLPQADALYNFAYHLTNYKEDDANDLVQDAYLKALRFMDKYVVGTNPKAWLFTILKNDFINKYRVEKRKPTKVDIEDLSRVQIDEDDAAGHIGTYTDLRSELFDNLMGDEVTVALQKMPEEFRVVIILCDLEGFAYEEIADILKIPVGTVRSRLFRARNMLKAKLKEYAESLGYQDKRK